jgi:hypothetical protein
VVGQRVPHAPQLLTSVSGFTQLEPQMIAGVEHTVVHTPAEQVALAAHAMPQPPQLLRSVVTRTSQPLARLLSQLAKPALQLAMPQELLTQAAVALAKAQRLPHAPQWVIELPRATSQPLTLAASQLPKPARQVMPQLDPTHTGAELGGVGQTVPQAPQLPAELVVFTSQPLAGLRSQSAVPAGQTVPQTPAVQRAVAPPPATHALPHTPQLAVSLPVATSQPLAALPSQLAKPAAQVPTAQAPAVHTPVPLATSQRVPQPPQWLASVVGLTHAPLQQDDPAPQAVPQAPQLAPSVVVFTQAVPQQVEPAPHARVALHPATHMLPWQMVPMAQSPSAVHPTQARIVVSQTVPAAQSPALRQPGTQALDEQ